MTPVGVVCGAGAFGRNHGRAERSLRRAKRAECRAIVRFLDPLQYLPADTDCRFPGIDLFHFEEPLGIMIPKLIAQAIPALGNSTDAAPLAVANFKHFRDQVLRRAISSPFDGTGILIFNLNRLDLPRPRLLRGR